MASDAEANDNFGYSVAISGDTAVVGADEEDTGGSMAGAAYVFDRNEGGTDNWGEVTKLMSSDAEASDYFGRSVAISSDTAVVGAYLEDTGGSAAGAAYVFERDQGGTDNWGPVTKLMASDAEANDNFGYSVAISGDTAVVGARNADTGSSGTGAAYVFNFGNDYGDPCTQGTECASGLCVDSVCCDSACGGGATIDCQACSVAAGGAANGTCGPRPNGLSCDDGLFCNGTETCTGGACGSSTGDPCPGPDGDNDCQESCVEANDNCLAADTNGSSCPDDGVYCNGTETCQGGTCSGAGDPCPGPNGDNDCQESCDETNDNCLAADPNGSSCLDDSLFCTGVETCQSGTCSGAGDPCAANVGDADGDCSESCDEASDSCTANDANSAESDHRIQ